VSLVELTDRRGDGKGAKSYDGEKAYPSINYSILSECSARLNGEKNEFSHSGHLFSTTQHIICMSTCTDSMYSTVTVKAKVIGSLFLNSYQYCKNSESG
jgi:hypothetical protein